MNAIFYNNLTCADKDVARCHGPADDGTTCPRIFETYGSTGIVVVFGRSLVFGLIINYLDLQTVMLKDGSEVERNASLTTSNRI